MALREAFLARENFEFATYEEGYKNVRNDYHIKNWLLHNFIT